MHALSTPIREELLECIDALFVQPHAHPFGHGFCAQTLLVKVD